MKRRAERHAVIGTGVATPASGPQLMMQYLDCLELLVRCSIALRDAEETAEDLLSDIERALDDAQAMGLIRIEVEPS
jgi:hypothetical protein